MPKQTTAITAQTIWRISGTRPTVRIYYQAIRLSRLIEWNHHQATKLKPQLEQSQRDIPPGMAHW